MIYKVLFYIFILNRGCRDRMVVEFTTTCAIT